MVMIGKGRPKLKYPSRNLHHVLWERAMRSSADFVEQHIHQALIFPDAESMNKYVIETIIERYDSGICLEFGVFKGESINYFSNELPDYQFYGFDSFLGLKEDWSGHEHSKGYFSLKGLLPHVNANVQLEAGWFHETLPEFIENKGLEDVKFIHIDSDTFESAETIFSFIGSNLKAGTLILFDELMGYPNWQNGEYRALLEASEKYRFQYRFRAFSSYQGLIEVL